MYEPIRFRGYRCAQPTATIFDPFGIIFVENNMRKPKSLHH